MTTAPQNASIQTQAQQASAIVQMVSFGPSAQRPGNPPPGFLYYDTSLNAEYVFNGASWALVSPPPAPAPVGYGTSLQRLSLQTPINGYVWWDTTLSAEYVCTDATTNTWAPATPVAPPSHYSQATSDCSAAQRTVYLAAGTWQLSIQTQGYDNDASGNSNITITQSATVAGLGSATSSMVFIRSGGAGFARNVGMSTVGVASIVVATAGTYTVSMGVCSIAGTTIGNFVPLGSVMELEKIS